MDPSLREITREMTRIPQSIRHEGALLIRGNAENGSFIEATDDIQVDGDVLNSKVRSINGSVIVKGGIKGPTAVVQAGKDIEASLAHRSTLKAARDIRLTKMAVEAQVTARNTVTVDREEGIIEGGEMTAGMEITANTIGSRNKTETGVRLVNYRQSEQYGSLLRVEKELAGLSGDLESLEKVIKVIRLLGDRVVQLPPEKKQDLALRIKRYNELKEKSDRLKGEKASLSETSGLTDGLDRSIIARKTLHEGVKAAIDNAVLTVQKEYQNVILYRKGIIVIAEFDAFMKKKKSEAGSHPA
jgi:uncharacterized protein (DUF342 family)